MIELAYVIKGNFLREVIRSPEINKFLQEADWAIEVKDFVEAANIFKKVRYLIETKYKPWRRGERFSLDQPDFTTVLK